MTDLNLCIYKITLNKKDLNMSEKAEIDKLDFKKAIFAAYKKHTFKYKNMNRL